MEVTADTEETDHWREVEGLWLTAAQLISRSPTGVSNSVFFRPVLLPILPDPNE